MADMFGKMTDKEKCGYDNTGFVMIENNDWTKKVSFCTCREHYIIIYLYEKLK